MSAEMHQSSRKKFSVYPCTPIRLDYYVNCLSTIYRSSGLSTSFSGTRYNRDYDNAEVFSALLQSLQKIPSAVTQIIPRSIPSTSFPIHHAPIGVHSTPYQRSHSQCRHKAHIARWSWSVLHVITLHYLPLYYFLYYETWCSNTNMPCYDSRRQSPASHCYRAGFGSGPVQVGSQVDKWTKMALGKALFSSNASFFTCQYHFTDCPQSFIHSFFRSFITDAV